MRRLLLHSLTHLPAVFFIVIFLSQGCTRAILQTYPASIEEITSVSESFLHFHKDSADVCGCCLDAETEAALSVSGWFSNHTGKLSGYLQAMEPGYIKLIAINPLGQPMFIFVTNGYIFKSLNVYQEKAYLGSVYSESFARYGPAGFAPEFSYYWLTGRLEPGEIEIGQVLRSREQGMFWLQIRHTGSEKNSMVLFDPAEQVILRHVLRDAQGSHLLDVVYGDYQGLSGSSHDNTANELCRVPAEISITSHAGSGKIELKLYGFLAQPHFTAEDFQVWIPDSFEQIPVE